MSNASDFIIENGVLKKYIGPGGDVVIPEGVIAIGSGVFNGNDAICKITLPESTEKIGKEAFYRSSLTEINLPEGLTTIGEGAFRWSKLSQINIPSSVATIGKSAFWGCGGLRQVSLSEGLKTIKAYAFEDCIALEEILIPETVRTVEEDAFWGCKKLAYLQLPAKLTKFQKIFGELLKTPLIAPGIPMKDIPSDYKENVVLGFAIAHRLNIQYPDTTKADYIAYIKRQKKKLLVQAVQNADLLLLMLEEKLIPADEVDGLLDSINAEQKALLLEYQAGQTTPDLPKKATELTLDMGGKTAAELKKEWKTKKLPDDTLCLSSYKGNDTVLFIPGQIGKTPVTAIGKDAMCAEDWRLGREQAERCKQITEIIIPRGICEIGEKAFALCAGLETITLSETVTSIGEYAFCVCSSLREVILPDNIADIGRYAFNGCVEIAEMTVPGSLTEIKEGMLSGCKKLCKVVVKEGVQKIGIFAFAFCDSLSEVWFPQSVTYIPPIAFDKDTKAVIHAPAGSYAENYAKENNIPFVAE